MPHLKVKPFDTSIIDNISSQNIAFRAFNINSNSELALVSKDNRDIFLDIIKRDKEYLIKPNKVTKGSDTTFLKDILNIFAKELKLDIISSNTNIKTTKPKIANDYFKNIEYFYNFKTDFKKVKIEVGFGSARHLLYRAKQESDTLFIGIEIHSPSINQLLKQINLQGLKNIIVVNYDARLLFEMLPSNILDTIYVHFPVPWDTKPHRRVINDKFVNEALRVLKKDGILELRTDSINYYRYSLEVFSSINRAKFVVDKNMDIEVISKYEQRWREMNKDIYTISLISLENSAKKKFNYNFDFGKEIKSEITLPKEPIIESDFFVHFGKFYKIASKKGFIVECSFGNFNMPERKMLVIEDDNIYYLPSLPVKSLANFKAHNIIKGYING